MTSHLLLTGATGLLGQFLLRDLLLAGAPVAVLARPRGSQSVAERVGRLMTAWEGGLGRGLPRPFCLEGDVAVPGLGLGEEQRRWVSQNCDLVLHCAASLAFRAAGDGEPWRTNRDGVANVLEFCRQAGLRQLHHVSTAYVCGRRTGVVREADLDQGQEFRNDYERCKFEAEKLVRAAGFLDSLTIYRPAVIVGDSRTGYTSTYHGLYPYLQFVWLLGRHARPEEDGRWRLPLRLNLTGGEGRNLVPVDWVSAIVTHIVLSPAWHGRTYHLTPARPVTAREIEEAAAECFHFYGPTFVGPDGLAHGELNEVEKLFYGQVALYEPYWDSEPSFDDSNTRAAAPHLNCPAVDGGLLRRLIAFAVQDRWGKGRRPG